MRNVLFVCSRNRLRSPTAEHLYAAREDLRVMSAGLAPDAEEPLSAEWVQWADLMFVMERAHLRRLRSRFGRYLHDEQQVVCLDIPDDFDYMQAELVDLLSRKLTPYLRPAA